ncbi:MAG: hypothetical protein ACRDSJ_25625 [Rubrobacteraceae bacterium]
MSERREQNRHTTEEIGRRGREIYDLRIRREVEPAHSGKFIVIDITTGEYEIGENGREASSRMRERNPDAVMHGTRVGARAAYRIGGPTLPRR